MIQKPLGRCASQLSCAVQHRQEISFVLTFARVRITVTKKYLMQIPICSELVEMKALSEKLRLYCNVAALAPSAIHSIVLLLEKPRIFALSIGAL